MYQGLVLFYVGAVLILNGLWMLGRIDDREIPLINAFVGGISLLVSLRLAFGADADAASIRTAAFSLLLPAPTCGLPSIATTAATGAVWAGSACSLPLPRCRLRSTR